MPQLLGGGTSTAAGGAGATGVSRTAATATAAAAATAAAGASDEEDAGSDDDGTYDISSFICPLSAEIMEDPCCTLADGLSYDRRAIREWFEQGHVLSPVTGLRCLLNAARKLELGAPRSERELAQLTALSLCPNHALRNVVEDSLRRVPELRTRYATLAAPLRMPIRLRRELRGHKTTVSFVAAFGGPPTAALQAATSMVDQGGALSSVSQTGSRSTPASCTQAAAAAAAANGHEGEPSPPPPLFQPCQRFVLSGAYNELKVWDTHAADARHACVRSAEHTKASQMQRGVSVGWVQACALFGGGGGGGGDDAAAPPPPAAAAGTADGDESPAAGSSDGSASDSSPRTPRGARAGGRDFAYARTKQSCDPLAMAQRDVEALGMRALVAHRIGQWEHCLKVWSVGRLQCEATLTGHKSTVTCCCVREGGRGGVGAAGGTLGLSGSEDRTVRVWDLGRSGGGGGGGAAAASYACLRTLTATAKVSSIAPSADHGHVAVGCRDGSVGTWDIETGARLLAFTGHESAVTCIASGVFDVNGREYLLSGDGDGELHLWDLRTALPICALAQQHDAKLTCCSLFQGKFAFCGSADGSSTVWNLLTGKCVKRVDAHAKGVTCAALHPNNKSVVTGGIDRIVKIWGVQDEVVALV
jgi:hypothetical protein